MGVLLWITTFPATSQASECQGPTPILNPTGGAPGVTVPWEGTTGGVSVTAKQLWALAQRGNETEGRPAASPPLPRAPLCGEVTPTCGAASLVARWAGPGGQAAAGFPRGRLRPGRGGVRAESICARGGGRPEHSDGHGKRNQSQRATGAQLGSWPSLAGRPGTGVAGQRNSVGRRLGASVPLRGSATPPQQHFTTRETEAAKAGEWRAVAAWATSLPTV